MRQPSKPQGTSTNMAGSLHPVRTKEQLTAGFPTVVPAITGDVTLHEIIRLWQHIKRCAQCTETNFDAQNFLYVVLPPGLWPYFSTRQYPTAPLDPGDNPSYNGGADATANTTIRDVWQLDFKYYEEHKHINAALVDRFLKLLPEPHRIAFESNQLTVNPKLSFLEVFDHFWEHFGMATEEELIENTAQLLNPWQPHEGMESLIDRFDKAQIYAFSPRTLWTTGPSSTTSLPSSKRQDDTPEPMKTGWTKQTTRRRTRYLKNSGARSTSR